MRPLATIILAAGKSTRMGSARPKVLHEIAGQSLFQYCIELSQGIGSSAVFVVVGHRAQEVMARFGGCDVRFLLQEEQLGTAHAVSRAEDHLEGFMGDVLILYGDVPLIKLETLRALLDEHQSSGAALTLLTAEAINPSGYGRILRGARGEILKIIEESEMRAGEPAIAEINSGVCCFRSRFLFKAIKSIKADNAKGEYYLTDAVEIARRQGEIVASLKAEEEEVIGINTMEELARARDIMRRRINQALMEKGVSLQDPLSAYVDLKVGVGQGTSVGRDVSILGRSEIGRNCTLGSNCLIVDSKLGDGSAVGSSSSIERCELRPGSRIKPNSHLADCTI